MRTLQEKVDAISLNDTYEWSQRQQVNKAIQELREEITQLAKHTPNIREVFAYRNVLVLIGEKK